MSATTDAGVPDAGYVAALAGFERMTARRLRALLSATDPRGAFAVAAGERSAAGPLGAMLDAEPELAAAWRRSARRRAPAECWERCAATGTAVVVPGDEQFPPQLLDDPACPAALFARGDLDVLDGRRVGIVGTRNATQRGREMAAQLGCELAEHDVVVVSGLARGVDGAAHRGALAADRAPVVAVVGNGPDVPYPRQHAGLWEAVVGHGVIVSEWPPGTPPDAFRFPLRNRILAALAEVLVVVESRERGGSLITAREALARDVSVMAVPGSPSSPASSGTNELLRDGAAPVTEAADVLIALGLDGRRARRARYDPRALPRGVDARVVEACRTEPRTIDALCAVCDLELAESAMALARLERDGWVRETGGWFEAIDRWDDLA